MSACTLLWLNWYMLLVTSHHVNYLGLGSSKDWQLMATIRAQDYTLVTNNRSAKSPTVSAQGVLCECVRVPTSPNLQGGLRWAGANGNLPRGPHQESKMTGGAPSIRVRRRPAGSWE